MRRWIFYFLISMATLMACTYEHPTDGQLKIDVAVVGADPGADPTGETAGEPSPFYADGLSHRTVSIEFVGSVTAGKSLTVTTSLGIINPAADAAGRRTLALKTTNGAALNFELYAERTPGTGRITVEGPGGTRAVDDFLLQAVTDELSIAHSNGDAGVVADGAHNSTLTISLDSPDESFRTVKVTTSLGVLSPEKKDEAARTRSVRVSPTNPADIEWSVGTTPGTAVITAELDDAFVVHTVDIAPPSRPVIALAVVVDGSESPTALADGQTTVPIAVTYQAPEGRQDSVTLTTTLGQLNPAGTSDEARRTTTIAVQGGKTSNVNLNVGRIAGGAVISATAASTSAVTKSLLLTAALPERLALEAPTGSVLDSARRETSVTVRLARSAGNGRISQGTSVQLLTCCDEGAGLQECTRNVTVPDFLEDLDGDGRESAIIALTPSGRTFVDTVASPTTPDLALALHAFVLKTGTASALPGCDDLAAEGTPDDIAAIDSLQLALVRKAPPAPPPP